MLDAYIINQIKKREEQRRQYEHPLNQLAPAAGPTTPPKRERGVVIINFINPDEEQEHRQYFP